MFRQINKIDHKDLFLKFFFTIAISLPILFFKVNDFEEYSQGIFSTIFLFSNINNFFSNFNSSIALGSSLPIGQGLFFYPTSFLSFNLDLFYFSTLFMNLLIQAYYFEKILKNLKIHFIHKFYNYLFNFLLIISVPNLAYNYIDNWISVHVSFTIYFPIIYYLIKYQNKGKIDSLGKISIFLIVYLYNGHIGYFLQFLTFLILFILINKTQVFINKKYFLFITIFLLLICFPRVYEYLVMYLSYPQNLLDNSIGNVSVFKTSNYIEMLLLPINYLLRILDYIFQTDFSNKNIIFNGRELGYGFQVLFSLIVAFWTILKNFSKRILYIDYIFLLFLSMIILLSIIDFQTYLNLSRDIIFILSLIILSFFLSKITSKKIKLIVILLLVVPNILLFMESLRHLVLNDANNIINEKKTSQNVFFKKELNKLSNDKSQFFRIYLSEQIFQEINQNNSIFFKKVGINTFKDFNKYNLNIFNVNLKNTSFVPIRRPWLSMHNSLYPMMTEIEDHFFMSFYRVKYLIIYENEFKKIISKNFKISNSFVFNDKKLLIVENTDFSNLLILENNRNLDILCNSDLKIECLNNTKDKFYKNNQVIIEKISNNIFHVKNNNNYSVKLLFPFLHNNNLMKKNNFSYLFENFKILEIPQNKNIEINYISVKYIFIKTIIILLFFLFIYLNCSHKFLIKNFKD